MYGFKEVSSIVLLKASQRLATRHKSVWIAGLAAALLVLGSVFALLRFATIYGRVISANSKQPIQGAMIYIHSGMPYEEDGINTYATTDADGKFMANARGEVHIRVWKPGYALRVINTGYLVTALRREIIIEVRELTSTNLVLEHPEIYDLSATNGFSFVRGAPVNGDAHDADIVIVPDQVNKTAAMIEGRGEGGILFQPYGEKVDFYNSPEAPQTGYRESVRVNDLRPGIYFVKTRDGKHYAKLSLTVYVAEAPNGARYLDLKQSKLWWAYQPDGSRNLEIDPGKALNFPVEEFGLKRELLGK
jgi:hypothetical protein